MREDFDYRDVPGDYLHCLNSQCPRTADCLRFQVALRVNKESASFSIVNPAYVAAREECPFFQLDRLTHFALGMKHLLDKVPHAKAVKIRNILYQHFERSMFYRIRNKTRLITPKEQAFIRQVFLNEGIKEAPVFDEYVEQYDW